MPLLPAVGNCADDVLSLELCVQRPNRLRCNERQPVREVIALGAIVLRDGHIAGDDLVEFNARCAYLRCGDGGHRERV